MVQLEVVSSGVCACRWHDGSPSQRARVSVWIWVQLSPWEAQQSNVLGVSCSCMSNCTSAYLSEWSTA